MGQLVNELLLKTGQHNQEIDKAKDKVHRYKEEADKAGKSVEEMGNKQSRSAKDLLDAMKEVEGVGRSTSNYRQQLAAITKQIQDLTINYRSMNDEMKSSDFGREVADKISELTQKASEYKDAIMDANQAVAALASDTAIWDGVAQGIDVVSSSLQALVSTEMLGEKSTEKLVAVMGKLQSMQKITNAIIKVGNFLQQQSKTIEAIRIIQSKALIKAKTLEAAATGKATIAQKLFNAVASANPYVLLAAAVIGVVGALAIFTKKSKEAEKAAKVEADALGEAKKEATSYQKALATTSADLLSKYKLLQIQYSKLKDDHQKSQWIKENADEFANLGLKIRSVNDAERDFVTNADNVVESLKVRARAIANQQNLVDLYKQLMDEEIRADEEYNARKAILSNEALAILDKLNKGEAVDPKRAKWAQDMAKHVEVFNAKLKADVYKTTDDIKKNIDTVAADLEGELDMTKVVKGAGGSSTIQTKVEAPAIPGSLRAAQEAVAKIQKELNDLKWDDPSIGAKKKELEDAKAEVERIQQILQTTKPADLFNEGSLAEANHFVSVFQNQLNDLNPDTDEFNEVNELLQIWLERQEEISKKVNKTKDAAKTVVEQYQEIVSKANDVSLQYKIGAIDKDEALAQIKELNRQLKDDLHLTATVDLQLNEDVDLTAFDKFLNKFGAVKDKVGGVVSSISSAYDSITGFSERLAEEEDGIKRFFIAWEAGMNIVNAATTTLEALAPIINAITIATEASALAKKKEAVASAENTVANEAESGSVLKTAIAKMMEAIAGGAKAVSSLGPIGPILAIAAAASITAALIAAFSKAKTQKFSQGGIYKGTSKIGDKNWARLNDGEMVLNTQQQKKLFQMLNKNGVFEKNNYPDLSKVEFVIQGDKLVGTFSNYTRKISHSKR